MPTPKKVTQALSQAFNQTKDSLNVLRTLEKETLAKAKSFVKIPSADEGRKLTNAKVVASLKNLGLATRAEVQALEARVAALEAALEKKGASRASKAASASASAAPSEAQPSA